MLSKPIQLILLNVGAKLDYKPNWNMSTGTFENPSGQVGV